MILSSYVGQKIGKVKTMYVKKQTDKDPYQIIITDKELKEAFRNPVTYELFRQALLSQVMSIYYQSRAIYTDDMEDVYGS